MRHDTKTSKGSRVVTVPQPPVAIQELPANRPMSVLLKSDEDVEWIWSPLPSGQQFVSGYKIVKRSFLKRLLRV